MEPQFYPGGQEQTVMEGKKDEEKNDSRFGMMSYFKSDDVPEWKICLKMLCTMEIYSI